LKNIESPILMQNPSVESIIKSVSLFSQLNEKMVIRNIKMFIDLILFMFSQMMHFHLKQLR